MEVITKENTDRWFPVCNRKRESSLAQSVERLTVNQDVTGSSPVGGAKKPVNSTFTGFIYFYDWAVC